MKQKKLTFIAIIIMVIVFLTGVAMLVFHSLGFGTGILLEFILKPENGLRDRVIKHIS